MGQSLIIMVGKSSIQTNVRYGGVNCVDKGWLIATGWKRFEGTQPGTSRSHWGGDRVKGTWGQADPASESSSASRAQGPKGLATANHESSRGGRQRGGR